MKASLSSTSIMLFAIAIAIAMAMEMVHAFMTSPLPQHAFLMKNRVPVPSHGGSYFPLYYRYKPPVDTDYLIDEPNSKLKGGGFETEMTRPVNNTSEIEIVPPIDNTFGSEFVPIENTYGIELMGGDKMNKDGLTGKGIKVAVIDSGIDETHEGFEGKVKVVDFYNVTNDEDDLKSYFEESEKYHGTHVAGTIQ